MFAVEHKTIPTPAMVRSAVQQVRRLSRPPLLWPMVLFPYLSEERLEELEREGVSGLDLCGNGVVIVPGEWLVRRTGKPNLYPQSFPIKNVFRGTSSLVARVFLRRPTYGGVGEIQEEIERLGGTVTLSTVSKVLARLEEELIVGRLSRESRGNWVKSGPVAIEGEGARVHPSGEIRLLQAEKLLQRLVENYRPPEVRRRFVGKCTTNPEILLTGPTALAAEDGTSIAVTGTSSARLYAAMALEETMSVYCSDMDAVLRQARRGCPGTGPLSRP